MTINEFFKLIKFNTVTWISIITLCELFVTGGIDKGGLLFVLYGIYKLFSSK